MYLTLIVNATKARMLYRQDRAEARFTLHETMRSGCVQFNRDLEYAIVDAIKARDTEPTLADSDILVQVEL